MRPSPNAPQVVKPDGGGAFNRDEEKRLNREAVATARISHRNVVTHYEHWYCTPYINIFLVNVFLFTVHCTSLI